MLPSGCAMFPAGTKPETMINLCYVGQCLLENIKGVYSDTKKDKEAKIILILIIFTL